MAGQRTCLAFFMRGELLYKVILIGLLAEMERKRKVADIARLQAWNKAHPDAWKKRQERYYLRHPERVIDTRARYNRTEKAKARLKRYHELHPDRIAITAKNYRARNIAKISAKQKQQRQQNAEAYRANDRARYRKTYEKYKPIRKAYAVAHREQIKKTSLERHHRLYRSDPAYKTACLVRNRLKKAINRKQMSVRTQELIGCTFDELSQHIQSQFLPGMTWQNHGVGDDHWHLDHRTPLASFDLTDPVQIAECFNFTNLQPLWGPDNLRKGAKLNYVLQSTTNQTPK